jgi:hypothetical protein
LSRVYETVVARLQVGHPYAVLDSVYGAEKA